MFLNHEIAEFFYDHLTGLLGHLSHRHHHLLHLVHAGGLHLHLHRLPLLLQIVSWSFFALLGLLSGFLWLFLTRLIFLLICRG